MRMITLQEAKQTTIRREDLSADLARIIREEHSKKVDILPDWDLNGWMLTPRDYVGFIPLTADVALNILPKVGLSNLFRMLEVAYDIPFTTDDGTIHANSFNEFYERLALIFARRVLARGRKGFYREYLAQEDSFGFVREQINLPNMLRRPWRASIDCRYHEHTADISDNQILSWTFERVLRSGLCSDAGAQLIRRAYREIGQHALAQPFRPTDCLHRKYNRLNLDYQGLHALAFFFLEHTGPDYHAGDHMMLPFLVDMDKLFERFVYRWLLNHLPDQWLLQAQERVPIGDGNDQHYDIDLVLRDAATGQVRAVLDTKYKTPEKASNADINQVVAYAESRHCSQGILVYPSHIDSLGNYRVGEKQVHCLWFDVTHPNLKQAGDQFLNALGAPERQ